jgi:hypothetical protein
MGPIKITGSSRSCSVPPGDVQALATRLRLLADDPATPLANAEPASSFLEGLLAGSPRWRTTELQEPVAGAMVHVLDLMLAEGSLSPPLYCVRAVLRSDFGFD